MSSETSSVLVAVRIRPFTKREDPMTCTVTVPDQTTITIADVPAAASTLTGTSSSSMSTSSGLGSTATGVGRETIGASGESALAKLAKEGLGRHSYTFDRIFWSIAPSILPLPPTKLMSTAQALSDSSAPSSALFMAAAGAESHAPDLSASIRSSSAGGGGGTSGGAEAKSMHRQQQVMTVAQQLPCFHHAPAYEDQAGIYAFIGPRLSKSVMSGFNACIFAYGQTGSGKSYSMIGPAERLSATLSTLSPEQEAELGIMPRLARDLFQQMREERASDESVTFTVEVSFLEVYCEKVRDLLVNCQDAGSTTTTTTTSAAVAAASTLRIRQHPTRGPYVEGLSHVRVRDAEHAMRCLNIGLRERRTAETKMNEHSSRSHAIMQMHVTKVTVVPDESSVTTKTRVCKVNMVDLAGSERVTQSGATGDRLEEAKNINLSLSTLGRVIQQLSEKQAGKNVVPAYRDSILTWLLSDSLGGNSKTIMLATVAPSAYCYHQTLNTLRFAGVAKKIVNVATVNEDQHFQQLVTELRQQIVRLTLQLENGKASQIHIDEIRQLKEEREVLLAQNDALRARTATMMDSADVQALRRRNVELEELNETLARDKVQLQQRLLSSSSALREDVAKKREELLKLQEQLEKREAALSNTANGTGVAANTNAEATGSAAGTDASATDGAAKPSDTIALSKAQAEIRKLRVQLAREQDENAANKKKWQSAARDLAQAKQAEQEAKDSAHAARQGREEYQKRWSESQRLSDNLQQRLEATLDVLDRTQTDITVLRSATATEAAKQRAAESAREALLVTQLEQMRQDYLNEKQANVQLLIRTAQVEQERSQLKKQEAAMQADVHELEQLLLEETESSERHYTRMRHQRALNEVLHYMVRTLQHEAQIASNARSTAGTRRTSFGMSPQASFAFSSSVSTSPQPAGGGAAHTHWEGMSSPRSPFSSALGGGPANAADFLATSLSVQNTAFTNELYHAQLEYECFCEESHQRSLLVHEYLLNSNRLWSHKARLLQDQARVEAAQHAETRDELQVLQDELASRTRRIKTLEDALCEAEAQQRTAAEAMQASELARLTLVRQLHSAEEAQQEASREVETLVERLAAAEAVKDALEERLHNYASPTDYPSVGGEGSKGELVGETRYPQPRVSDSRVTQLTAQCEAYQEELGALRAQLDQQLSDTSTHTDAAQRENAALALEVRRLTEAKQSLSQALDAAVRDHGQRVAQQQRMIDTLRTALEEETKMADLCRSSAQTAEAARQAADEDRQASQTALNILQSQKRALEEGCQALEADVTELRQHYGSMERQLVELQAREPELYLLLEKGAAEDSVAWMGKARQEKANLQKQKLEARRMNSELLQHVRQRTTHLRDVQKQLWDLPSSTPTATPSALSTTHSEASTPLARSTRGSAVGGAESVGAQRHLDLDQRSVVSPSSIAHSDGSSPTAMDKARPALR